jgi:hypothetical protein
LSEIVEAFIDRKKPEIGKTQEGGTSKKKDFLF